MRKLYLIAECQPISIDGMMELENHDLAAIQVITITNSNNIISY